MSLAKNQRNFLFERAFTMMKNGVYLIVRAPLVAELFGILICANWMTCDVTVWMLQVLYLPKMKTGLFVAPEFNKLCFVCAV